MTKSTKRIAFYIAILVFFGVSYIAVLYAQGYKYDFQENEFFKTGAVYLKVNTDASVFIDDVESGNTSFLGKAFSARGLLPGDHLIRVQKEGYYPWQKTVTIEEGLVADFPRILLLAQSGPEKDKLKSEIASVSFTPPPRPGPYFIQNKDLFDATDPELTPLLIASNVNGFALSENEDKLMWWNNPPSAHSGGGGEIWLQWLKDTNYQPYMKKGDQELVVSFSAIKEVAWFRDNDHLVANIGGVYRILEIDKRGGINIVKI